MKKINCCYLNSTLQAIYQEQIQGKRYFNLGYSATFYHLFKNLEKQGFLCEKCVSFSRELAEIYTEFNQKYQNICYD
jgi:hypothetical protein